jgi:hypothetical protein
MSRTSKTTTKQVVDVRKVCQKIGDTMNDNFASNNDTKSAQAAIHAYGVAIKAAQTQLIYKKLTGSPGRIEFFESTE